MEFFQVNFKQKMQPVSPHMFFVICEVIPEETLVF